MTDIIPKLDRKNPALGTIQPPYDGAQYELNGDYFAGNGDYLFSQDAAGARMVKGAAKSAAPKAASGKAASTTDMTALRAQIAAEERAKILAEMGTGNSTPPEPPAGDSDPDKVDFTLWATGEKTYEWFKVKAAAAEMFGEDKVDTTSKVKLLESLRKLGAIPKDPPSPKAKK